MVNDNNPLTTTYVGTIQNPEKIVWNKNSKKEEKILILKSLLKKNFQNCYFFREKHFKFKKTEEIRDYYLDISLRLHCG